MNRDLGDLLRHAVPEPIRALDPDDILSAARRGSAVQRWSGPLIAVVVLVAAVVAGPQLFTREQTPATPDVSDVPLRLSALEHRVKLGTDAAGSLRDIELVHPGEGALVATLNGVDIYLVEATGDRLCIVEINELNGGGSANGCQPRSELLTTGVMLSGESYDGRVSRFVVAAPDGYSTLTSGNQSAIVVSNVAVLDSTMPGKKLTISGPDVPAVTFDVSFFASSFISAKTPTKDDLTRSALSDLARSAQAFAQEHGSSAGFANATVAESPVIGREMRLLTDTIAVAQENDEGRCLTMDLLSGELDDPLCKWAPSS